MAHARLAWLAGRFAHSLEAVRLRRCPYSKLSSELDSLCGSCRAASAIDGVWRFRRVGSTSDPLAVFALGRYRGPDGSSPSPAAMALMQFKYGRDRAIGRALARAVVASEKLAFATTALVVPIPLHPRRLRERGFNQAAWLARAFARRNDARLAADALTSVIDLPRRPGLSRLGRSRTTGERFAMRRSLPPGAHVVIVDDVCTTGLTLCAARSTLEATGIRVRCAAVLLSTERDDESLEGDETLS